MDEQLVIKLGIVTRNEIEQNFDMNLVDLEVSTSNMDMDVVQLESRKYFKQRSL